MKQVEEEERIRMKIRKEEEQKQMGKGCIGCLGIIVVLAIAFVVIFNLAGDDKRDKNKTEASSASINPADYDSLILTTFKKHFKGIADVSFNSGDKLITLTPISEDFKTSIAAMQNGAITDEAWDKMTGNITNLSKKIKEKFGEGYTINLANPANPENTLLMIKDGIVAYDFSKEAN